MPLDRAPFRYTPNYCEENIWHLAGDDRVPEGARWVALISNRDRVCPLWAQRAAQERHAPVCWDYHVILIAARTEGDAAAGALVYDLDSVLPFPSALDRYVAETFGPGLALPERYAPRFRLIEATEYRARFDSDRSHMRRPDGSWSSPPPSWPLIAPPPGEVRFTLFEALDLAIPGPGEVLDAGGLLERFGLDPSRGPGPRPT